MSSTGGIEKHKENPARRVLVMLGMVITKLRMRIPDLKVQADVADIKTILAGAPGIDAVVVDYEAGIVEATTAAQDNGAALIQLLSKGGFTPSEVERSGMLE